jgi:hypothetical protein
MENGRWQQKIIGLFLCECPRLVHVATDLAALIV